MLYELNVYKDMDIDLFKFLGKVLGKAFFEGIPVETKLSKFLMRVLAHEKFELEDIEDYDP